MTDSVKKTTNGVMEKLKNVDVLINCLRTKIFDGKKIVNIVVKFETLISFFWYSHYNLQFQKPGFLTVNKFY